MSTRLSEANSAKFRFWSFVSMLFLVVVHGYNLNMRFLQPWTMPGEPMTFTAFFEYFTANGLLRFRIPLLFLISGFLYALHDSRYSYLQTIRGRVRSLLVPTLLWSVFSVLVIFLIEQFSFGRDVISATRILQIDETRLLLSQHTLLEVVERSSVLTPAYQLWFLRALFLLNLIYPLLLRAIQKKPWRMVFFSVAFLGWLLGIDVLLFIEGEGVLFFTLGVWIQKSGFDMDGKAPLMPVWAWGLVFVSLAAGKTVLAFHGAPILGNAAEPVLLLLYKAVVASGLVFAWFSSTELAQNCMQRKWFAEASAFSFVIYTAHAPLVAFAVEALIQVGGGMPYTRLIGFILLPVGLVAGCIALGWTLRKIAPSLFSLMTGKRGTVAA